MPGRRINRTQVVKYMEHRKELEQEAAAAKAGISVRSARRIERAGDLPAKQEARVKRHPVFTPGRHLELTPLFKSTSRTPCPSSAVA
jgi:hypothetical protein